MKGRATIQLRHRRWLFVPRTYPFRKMANSTSNIPSQGSFYFPSSLTVRGILFTSFARYSAPAWVFAVASVSRLPITPIYHQRRHGVLPFVTAARCRHSVVATTVIGEGHVYLLRRLPVVSIKNDRVKVHASCSVVVPVGHQLELNFDLIAK